MHQYLKLEGEQQRVLRKMLVRYAAIFFTYINSQIRTNF